MISGQSQSENARIADDLANVLVNTGEGVLRCTGGLGDKAVTSTRIGAATFRVKDGLLVSNSTDFIIVDIGWPPSSEMTQQADAMLFVVEPGFITKDSLKSLFDALASFNQKGRKGWLGVVCLHPAQWASSQTSLSFAKIGRMVTARARA